MYGGWYCVAFVRELDGDVTPAAIGSHRLVLVDRGEGIAAFDATCPHRGAHLGYGGVLDGDVIICPFHGRRIGLGDRSGRPYRVHGYRTLAVGGSVFVLLYDEHENGLTDFITRLAPTHFFVPGFVLDARVAPEYVIENVFDADHFRTVHGIRRRPRLTVRPGDAGELSVEAVFETRRANRWQQGQSDDGSVKTRFCAHVFSPTLVASELGEEGRAHVVFTSATPGSDGGSVIRVSLAVHGGDDGRPPPQDVVVALLHDSRRAFAQDMEVWEHLDADAPARFARADRPVIEYRRFCRRFLP